MIDSCPGVVWDALGFSNPQLDEEIELMGIRKPSHWEYSSWFARAFGDLNFTWGA